ncbi:hypothetical protein PHYC_02537 [Phycisphaerales bacterium]|nr:hypothetical protein PHYC_02537 [Phycisphaerales bacterium]
MWGFIARRSLFVLMLVVAVLAWPARLLAQQVGDCIRLKATNPAGVPRHARAENSFTGERFPDQSVAKVLELAAAGKWLRVEVAPAQAWISSAYSAGVVPCGGGVASPPAEIIVGAWNIEWLKNGKARGFNEMAGQIPERTDADYDTLASIITGLDVKILMLEEIHADVVPDGDGALHTVSPELDRLVGKLGAGYKYIAGRTGNEQHLAVLYDERAVNLRWWCEGSITDEEVNGSDLFDRQPLLAHFAVFSEGVEMNDLVVVALHLASGQNKTKNHDMAMSRVVNWIETQRQQNGCVPLGERDILIGGDLNASRFDGYKEHFFDDLEAGAWDVLADSDATYPSTRLAGIPPGTNVSKIDYLLASRGPGALAGAEIVQAEATVHTDLVAQLGGGMAFRTRASDHLPVTVRLRVVPDDD